MNQIENSRRRGYVLLMTLALLVMAATLLVSVGRIAIHRSLAADLAEQEFATKVGHDHLSKCGVAVCRTDFCADRSI